MLSKVYLNNKWDEIVNRRILDIPGSCTEGQVSHILSERFSRNPMGWSKEGLGKLSKLRVYVKNGGKIKGEHFRKGCQEKTPQQLDTIISQHKVDKIHINV